MESFPSDQDVHLPVPEGPLALHALSLFLADAVLIVDLGGTVTYAGAGLCRVAGLSPEAVQGRPLDEILHPDDVARLPVRLDAEGLPFVREIRMRSGDGGWVWVHLTSGAADGAGGPPDGLRSLFGDATLVFVRDLLDPGYVRDHGDLLRKAFDAVDNLVVVTDPRLEDHPIVLVNEHFLTATGYERHEVVGRNCRFLQVRPDGTRDDAGGGQAEALAALREAVATGAPVDVLLRNYRKDGSPFHNRLYLSPIRNEAGDVVYFVGVQNDVTEEVEQTRAASRQEGVLRSFFDSVPFLMGVVEREGDGLRHRAANEAVGQFFGVDRGAVEGALLADLGLTAAEEARWVRQVEACEAAGAPAHFETVYPWGADPQAEGARLLSVTVNGAGGSLVSYVAEDVTERRAADRERHLLATAVASAAEAIIVTDATIEEPGPRTVYVNAAHERLFGYSAEEVVGRSPRMYQGPKTDRAVLDRIRRKLAAGEPVRAETYNYRKDGTPFILEWEIAPVHDESGRVTRWVGTQRDVTERRRLEHEILEVSAREQERMARELHDGLGQVLTGSSYLLGALQQGLAAEGRDALAAEARRAGDLVGEALRQARSIARGLFPIHVEPDGLVEALTRAAGESASDLSIACTVHADGPVVLATSDQAGHLFRIVQEAVTNAVRHGRAQRVTITLRPDPGGDVELSVVDDGVGITDETLEREPGLGLRTMAYRAHRVGGALEVRPGAAGGTEVRVVFRPSTAPEDGA